VAKVIRNRKSKAQADARISSAAQEPWAFITSATTSCDKHARRHVCNASAGELSMKLTGLFALHASMTAQNLGRYKFRFDYKHLIFECLLFIDTKPIELVMGAIDHDFAIYLNIGPAPNFQLTPFIEPKETFWALLDALRTGGMRVNPFDSTAFFSKFNESIPPHATPDQVPTGGDYIRYFSSIEDPDKIYFFGWLDNDRLGNCVSEANLTKTHRYFGQRIYELARRTNQSTRWTHLRRRAVDFFEPDFTK